MSKIIVGVGVSTVEDFAVFGPLAADEVAGADIVVALGRDGDARDLIGGDEVPVYVFDGGDSALFECCERIKLAWEAAKPKEGHLGHAAVGMWLFYWFAPDLSPMHRLSSSGRVDELRAAASDFIEAGFGELRAPRIKVPA